MSQWDIKRKKRYTEIGIQRLKCIRCGEPALYQWQICADGNNYRPICDECDIGLNEVVLRFMRHPETTKLLENYSI